jgi:hypothetical protein
MTEPVRDIHVRWAAGPILGMEDARACWFALLAIVGGWVGVQIAVALR